MELSELSKQIAQDIRQEYRKDWNRYKVTNDLYLASIKAGELIEHLIKIKANDDFGRAICLSILDRLEADGMNGCLLCQS